ncbi:MAG: hypothetical protein RBT20_13600 [Syntrophales bacterium]|jgi:hypothetical protein|nr:hypothetical protein [Syntrophales bacterium]
MIVAVTGLSTGSEIAAGIAVLKALRLSNVERLIGLAASAFEVGSYQEDLLDAAYLVPPIQEQGPFLDRLAQIKAEAGMDAVIPALDNDVRRICAMAAELDDLGIRALLPGERVLADLREGRFPATVAGPRKDPEGRLRGSLPALVKSPVQSVSGQRNVLEDEFSVCVLADRRHHATAVAAIKKLLTSKGGSTWMALSVDGGELAEMAAELVVETGWTGPLTLDFIRNEKGAPFLTALHPRFADWINFPAAERLNLPGILLDILGGRETAPPQAPPAGRLFVRTAIDIVTDMGRFGTLSLTGEIRYDDRK